MCFWGSAGSRRLVLCGFLPISLTLYAELLRLNLQTKNAGKGDCIHAT